MWDWALMTGERFLAPLGRRWEHSRRVAALAQRVGPAFGPRAEELRAAAVLHDVGYAPELALTGFHPLDGARFLRAQGHEELACLVAHHSGGRHEAKLRGIEEYEAEFPFGRSELDQALTYCDLTTGPDGTRMSLDARIGELVARYGEDHVVARAIVASRREFEEAVIATERRVADAGIEITGSLALLR